MTRVVLVDDHPVVREGIARFLESAGDLTVVGEAAEAAEALDICRRERPDVVVVDLALGQSSGLDLIASLKSEMPEIGAVVVSMYEASVYAPRAMSVGALGYVQKDRDPAEIVVAVRRVAEGKPAFSEEVRAQFRDARNQGRGQGDPAAVLTNRELEVFRAIGEGRGNREIAESLHLSIKTVYKHIERIKAKLRLTSGRQLVHVATEWVAGNR